MTDLSDLRSALNRRYWTLAAKWEYGPRWNMATARRFLGYAWAAFCGRMLIVDSHEGETRGGYKVRVIVVGSSPLSKESAPR